MSWIVALAGILLWSASGEPQSTACVVERGLDPLDILNVGLKHNVYIVQDVSCSMKDPFLTGGNETKFDASKRILTDLVNETVDAAGVPTVNWALYVTEEGGTPSCSGAIMLGPPACGGNNRQQMLDAIKNMDHNCGTPLGGALEFTGNQIDPTKLQPGQKNIVILVTDGQEGCEPGSAITPKPKLQIDSYSPNVTKVASKKDDYSAYRAGLKADAMIRKIDPDATPFQEADCFVVGMDLGVTEVGLTNHIAWQCSKNSRGAVFASDANQLKTRLKEALGAIGIPPATVTVGTSVVASVKELISTVDPKVTNDDVFGDVSDSDDLSSAILASSTHKDNVLLSTFFESSFFRGHLEARKVYDVVEQTVSGQTVKKKLASFQKLWDAGAELQKRLAGDRTILFNRVGDATLREFKVGNVTPAELGVGAGFLSEIDGVGAKTANDAAEIVVRVVRGERLARDPNTGTIYRKQGSIEVLNFSDTEADGKTSTWKLFDATATGPAVVGPVARAYDTDPVQHHAPEFAQFWKGNFNRQTLVYLATNGGMMHAFRAENGSEAWAYIPDDVLGPSGEPPGSRSTLKDLVKLVVTQTNGLSNHPFLMSGAASAEDVFLSTKADWRTVIAFGRGRAGRHLSALDVTDVGDWNPTTPDTGPVTNAKYWPTLLWNVGNRQGLTDGPTGEYDKLGETWSIPVMGEVKLASGSTTTPQPVVFAGSGYGCKSSDEGQYLYLLKVEDGSVLRRLGPITEDGMAPVKDNVLVASPALFNPHARDPQKLDPRDYVTRVYVGDLQGNVWKLDCSSYDPNAWTFKVFAQLGLNQPIGAPVALLGDDVNTVYVYVGTGGDERVPSSSTQFKLAGYVDKDADGASTPGQLIQPGGGASFSINLAAGERVYVAPVTARTPDGTGVAYFASSSRQLVVNLCQWRYQSTVYAFAAKTGASTYDLDPDTSGTQSSDVVAASRIGGLFLRDEHLYVTNSGGIGSTWGVQVRGSSEFRTPTGIGESGSVTLGVVSFGYSPF